MHKHLEIIRPIKKEDIPIICATFCFPWTTIKDTQEKWQNYYQEYLDNKRFIAVVEFENKILGYGSLILGSKYPYFLESNIPEISDIWILEDYRRKGYGKALISDLEKKAASLNYSKIGLGVGLYKDYGSAQKLYYNLGYKPDGRGITYNFDSVIPGNSYPVDDDLVLWLIKDLMSK